MTGLDSFLEDVPGGFHWEILDALGDGVYLVDQSRRIMYWSQGAAEISGYRVEEALGRHCSEKMLMHVDVDGHVLCKEHCPLNAVMADGKPREAHVYMHHRDGHRVPVHVRGWPIRDMSGQIIGAFETFTDRTARVDDMQRIKQLQNAAFCDALTGVANRRFLESAITGRLAEFSRTGIPFGLAVGDIDHFKAFNDTHGHAVGDEVLRMVAQTLRRATHASDLVGRWGGEEFVVILGVDQSNLRTCVEQLRALVAESSLTMQSGDLRATISLGATMVQPDDDLQSIVTRADRMLYHSKAAGRNRVTIADTPALAPVAQAAACECHLR
ncbi:MAG: GGDEF domain-containing protein [Phycisphaerales bacterium]|nr:GGDEF domain-containing protein [Phycisphaerales bacterium]